MSNAENSAIAHLAVDTIAKIAGLAHLGLSYDSDSIAAAALKDILRAIDKFKKKGMEA